MIKDTKSMIVAIILLINCSVGASAAFVSLSNNTCSKIYGIIVLVFFISIISYNVRDLYRLSKKL